jgi:diadenosine tetraphosphate (Ap4A) HIT family hydrolase
MNCLFCDIVSGKVSSYRIWENDTHLAFLSIYPNTIGATVVIPRKHYSSYIVDMDDKTTSELLTSAKIVAKIIDEKFKDVGRTAIVFEGFGVDHLHAKLFPMHGTGDMTEWKPIKSNIRTVFEKYEGYISSHDGSLASHDELSKVQKLLGVE